MKQKKKILGILMSVIMVFSMSSQFALAAQTGADISNSTTPAVSTEKGAEPGSKDADKQDKEDPAEDKGTEKNISEKNDGVKENDGETKTDQSIEKKESKEDSYNRSPITASKVSRGIAVQVTAPKGSFPEGTTASIKLVSALESDVTFDITFTDKDGKEVQPQKGKEVSVNFTVAKSSALIAEKGSTRLSVYHIDRDGSADMIGTATTKGKTTEIETKSDHFSNFLVRGAKAPENARGAEKEVDVTITDFKMTNSKGENLTEVSWNSSFFLDMKWSIKNQDEIVHQGDYFDIKLPDNMRFIETYTTFDFPLTDENGDTIANAHVTPGPDNSGGTVRVTFNDKIENKYNVKGTIRMRALFYKTKINVNQTNVFTVIVNGVPVSTEVKVNKEINPNESIGKWGERVKGTDKVKWYVRLNYKKDDLKNLILSDSLDGGETYITDSFNLNKVTLNDEGSVTGSQTPVDLTGKLSFGEGNKSFSINLGNEMGTAQLWLTYESTYIPGTTIKNKAKIQYDGTSAQSIATYTDQGAGGTAGGDLANKIKLTKVDEEDHSIVLAGAVFRVTAPDGNTFKLTTGADGTVTSGYLTQGTYTVREVIAPTGYVMNDEDYTLEVNASGGALKTITNKKARTEVNVTKAWNDSNNQDGKRPNAVIVHLLADGADTGKTLTLTEAEQWKGTFSDLDKYNDNGEEIEYTISEDPVSGYEAVITGDAESGYAITNKHTPEKTNISGQKTWKDNEDQDGARPDSIMIRLYANGTEIQSKTVSTADNWSWEFPNLPKYENGTEILYTVTEDAIDGYSTEVNGFDVTNTHAPGKTSVTVTKAWDDNNNQDGKRTDSIKVQLYADGVKSGDEVTLDASNQWTHTWNDLDQKANQKDIEYTVREVEVPEGYTAEISGDAAAGYTITNRHTPEEISVSGSKTWEDNNDQDGVRPDFITINLLADGVQIDSKTVRASDNWTWDFSGLPKYKDGKEILYTVTENAVKDYSTTYDGFHVKNTHAPGKTSVTVTKTWNDTDDKDGVRPKKVTIHLLADGKDTGKTLTLSHSNDWRGSFTDLDEFKDGKKITYTILETEVDKYTSSISGNAEEGFKVTNTHEVGPATGDDSNLALYLALFGGSLAAILYLLYRRKKDTIHE